MIILTQEILELIDDNNAFIVLVKSIAKRASFDINQSCFPGTSLMCKDTNLSRSSVIRARQWLADKGIIKIRKKGKAEDGQYQVNEYFIDTDLIKVVGNLRSKGVVSEIDGGSVRENLPSVRENLGVVSEIDSNLKINLTSRPFNQSKLTLLEKIKSNPLYKQNKDLKFPDLTDEEIELTINTALVDNPKLNFNSALNWLANENLTKKKRLGYNKPTTNTKIKEIKEFYNSTFSKNLLSSVSWEDNASYWLEVYSLEQIKQAIANIDHPNWWANKPKNGENPSLPTLDLLFRTRNKSGKCDYIGEILSLGEKPVIRKPDYDFSHITQFSN